MFANSTACHQISDGLVQYFLLGAGVLFGTVLKGVTGAEAPIITIPITYSCMMGPQPSQTSLFPVFYPMSGKAESFAVTKSQASLLWPAWGNDCDNQFSISCALASVTHFLRYFRCLFDISSIKTRLDLTNQRSALGRWLALSVVHCKCAAGISTPVSITFLNVMKLPRLTFISVISMFFWYVCGANPNARQLWNIDPASGWLRRYWHRLDLFGYAFWRAVDDKNPHAAV